MVTDELVCCGDDDDNDSRAHQLQPSHSCCGTEYVDVSTTICCGQEGEEKVWKELLHYVITITLHWHQFDKLLHINK